MNLLLAPCPEPALEAQDFEIVERKGIGHPDTICDALAEAFSAGLSRWYIQRFGFVAHHNVDKVLLRGGCAAPAFGAGEVLAPMEIYLAGRATAHYRGVEVPIADIAQTSCRRWLQEHLHALDVDKHVRLHVITHPGSPDLVDLFMRQREDGALLADTLLANDTSCGVGYWPLSPLERAVHELESTLNARECVHDHPEFGEDVKVMGIRRHRSGSLTISRAMIGQHLPGLESYAAAVAHVKEIATRTVPRVADLELDVTVNAADAP
ncbi:MAG: methionine adenosyltransferase, partial [Gammaproteobacteria bacterium]